MAAEFQTSLPSSRQQEGEQNRQALIKPRGALYAVRQKTRDSKIWLTMKGKRVRKVRLHRRKEGGENRK